jgi:hypothetical protein
MNGKKRGTLQSVMQDVGPIIKNRVKHKPTSHCVRVIRLNQNNFIIAFYLDTINFNKVQMELI